MKTRLGCLKVFSILKFSTVYAIISKSGERLCQASFKPLHVLSASPYALTKGEAMSILVEFAKGAATVVGISGTMTFAGFIGMLYLTDTGKRAREEAGKRADKGVRALRPPTVGDGMPTIQNIPSVSRGP
jgi:hypothetical protein